jgi:hypothetical protein
MKSKYLWTGFAVLCLAAILAAVGCSSSGSGGSWGGRNSVTFSYADTIAWDTTYDVVVVGFGGAGAVTAITAADEGAKVLLVEKAPEGEEGGNTRFAGQHVVDYTSYDEGVKYLKAVRGLFTNWPDEFIERYVRDLSTFKKWWDDFGYTSHPPAGFLLPKKLLGDCAGGVFGTAPDMEEKSGKNLKCVHTF